MSKGVIYTSISCISKILKLKINNDDNISDICYKRVEERYYNFLKLYFEEMGYISS
jgi:hypothetical protein